MNQLRIFKSGDSAVVFDPETGRISVSNRLGTRILEELRAGATPQEIRSGLIESFGVSPEIADRDIMVRDIKVYLGAVLRIANADVLPFDWRAQAKEFLETIARYQKGAGDHFDLSPARREAMALKRDLDAFHAKLAARKLRKDKANRVIMKLARILVPINYTRGPRFRHDPATPIPALPTISIAEIGRAHV